MSPFKGPKGELCAEKLFWVEELPCFKDSSSKILCLISGHFLQAFFDMHMMVAKPEQWVEPMAEAGADQYTFHLEATKDANSLIRKIREAGMKVSVKSLFPPC